MPFPLVTEAKIVSQPISQVLLCLEIALVNRPPRKSLHLLRDFETLHSCNDSNNRSRPPKIPWRRPRVHQHLQWEFQPPETFRKCKSVDYTFVNCLLAIETTGSLLT